MKIVGVNQFKPLKNLKQSLKVAAVALPTMALTESCGVAICNPMYPPPPRYHYVPVHPVPIPPPRVYQFGPADHRPAPPSRSHRGEQSGKPTPRPSTRPHKP